MVGGIDFMMESLVEMRNSPRFARKFLGTTKDHDFLHERARQHTM
jgi:hypothetical protein